MTFPKDSERMPALSPLDWLLVKASGVIAVVYFVWALVQPAPPPPKPIRPGETVVKTGPVRDESCRFIGSQLSRGCYPYPD